MIVNLKEKEAIRPLNVFSSVQCSTDVQFGREIAPAVSQGKMSFAGLRSRIMKTQVKYQAKVVCRPALILIPPTLSRQCTTRVGRCYLLDSIFLQTPLCSTLNQYMYLCLKILLNLSLIIKGLLLVILLLLRRFRFSKMNNLDGFISESEQF